MSIKTAYKEQGELKEDGFAVDLPGGRGVAAFLQKDEMGVHLVFKHPADPAEIEVGFPQSLGTRFDRVEDGSAFRNLALSIEGAEALRDVLDTLLEPPQTATTRETGFYWVRHKVNREVEVGQWDEAEGTWIVAGVARIFPPEDFEVLSGRLVEPGV